MRAIIPHNQTHMTTRLIMTGFVLLLSLSIGLSAQAGSPAPVSTSQAYPNTPELPFKSTIYLPVIGRSFPSIELFDAWTSGAQFARQLAFLPGAGLTYHVSGINRFITPVQVSLRWTQSGPCGASTIVNTTITIAPGAWEHTDAATAPNCTGVFTSTVQVTYKTTSAAWSTRFVTNTPSAVVLNNGQGFDVCYIPPVDQMQTWWTNSPYRVFNLYLGGSAFGCKDQPLDAIWAHQVASQGWTFILTWVGPQAPCTNFKYKMSADPLQAYTQGQAEADSAVNAATRLGFFGSMAIYYDVEAYSGATSSCRTAVQSFLRGWTARLHSHNFKAGGYGGACSSYVTDWAANNPAPDDVWIAHWYKSTYDPGATVWATPCVSDSLWANHQRIKQYVGGHNESWGGVTLNIDSNVLDGQITALLGAAVSTSVDQEPAPSLLKARTLRAAELVSQNQGWALVGERLLWTEDGGAGWRDISPNFPSAYRILGVTLRAPLAGWLVIQPLTSDRSSGLQVLRTQDGEVWQARSLPQVTPEEADSIEAAYLDHGKDGAAMLALKLQSGSSFSLGRLFATQDGGLTWQERSLPLGEPVRFVDALHGWTAGGPAGNLLYYTEDGGSTWQPQVLQLPPGNRAQVGLPHFLSSQAAWLPVMLTGQAGNSLALFASQDAGRTWSLENSQPLGPGTAWGGLPLAAFTFAPDFQSSSLKPLLAAGALPGGVIALSFFNDRQGWAVVQEGVCQGVKQPATEMVQPGDQPFRCELHTRLVATADGGIVWREISP